VRPTTRSAAAGVAPFHPKEQKRAADTSQVTVRQTIAWTLGAALLLATAAVLITRPFAFTGGLLFTGGVLLGVLSK
jgi:hypothetical protein